MSLLELAERCEKASGPDRAIDAEIAVLLDGLGSVADCSPAYLYAVGNSFEDIGTFTDIPAYTSSLDAAMSLVPEGFDFGCGSHDATGKAWAWCGARDDLRIDNWKSMFPANAATPALALTAASLRARSDTPS